MSKTLHFLALVPGYAVLWWILTKGDPSSWLVGAPIIVFATLVSLYLYQPQTGHPSLLGIVRFIPYFILGSVKGGINVARGVLRTPMNLQPCVIEFHTQLPAGTPRALLTGVANLLPGTLIVSTRDDYLQVHVLDRRLPVEKDLHKLEHRVADLFGIQITDKQSGVRHG